MQEVGWKRDKKQEQKKRTAGQRKKNKGVLFVQASITFVSKCRSDVVFFPVSERCVIWTTPFCGTSRLNSICAEGSQFGPGHGTDHRRREPYYTSNYEYDLSVMTLMQSPGRATAEENDGASGKGHFRTKWWCLAQLNRVSSQSEGPLRIRKTIGQLQVLLSKWWYRYRCLAQLANPQPRPQPQPIRRQLPIVNHHQNTSVMAVLNNT